MTYKRKYEIEEKVEAWFQKKEREMRRGRIRWNPPIEIQRTTANIIEALEDLGFVKHD